MRGQAASGRLAAKPDRALHDQVLATMAMTVYPLDYTRLRKYLRDSRKRFVTAN